VSPSGPELSELITRFFAITLCLFAFLFLFSFCFFSLPEMVNKVEYLWNSTNDYSTVQAERQLSRIQWSVHIIAQPEMEM